MGEGEGEGVGEGVGEGEAGGGLSVSVNAFSESAENEAERAMVDLGLPAVVARADDRRVAMRAFACFLRAVIAGAVSSQSTGYRVQGELGRAHSMPGGTGYRVQGERSRQSSSSARAAIASRFLLRPCLSPLHACIRMVCTCACHRQPLPPTSTPLGGRRPPPHVHAGMHAHTMHAHTMYAHTMHMHVHAHVHTGSCLSSRWSPLYVAIGCATWTSTACPRGVHVHIMHKHGCMPARCACTHHA